MATNEPIKIRLRISDSFIEEWRARVRQLAEDGYGVPMDLFGVNPSPTMPKMRQEDAWLMDAWNGKVE